ncbi:MAG: hypothetical protein M5R41_01730 [Bacteroidia bacterium]|nr:hypothetical protein [Bacteroidia bacterium]
MNDSAKAEKTTPPLKQRLQRLALLATSALAVLLLIWIPVSNMITDARHQDALSEMRDHAAAELDTRTRLLLSTLSDAMRPGLTKAITEGSVSQLRTQLLAVQGAQHLKLGMVADGSGIVQVSTDPRLEGSILEPTYRVLTSSLTQTMVDTTAASAYRVIVPLEQGGTRLGTAVLEYDFSVR